VADLELRANDAVLNLDTVGGGMRALRVGDWEVLDGYRPGERHSGRRGHVLAPWPSRIFRGRYRWGGVEHELPISDAKHESATHGLVDTLEWAVDRLEQEEAELSVRIPRQDGYPFDVTVRVRYRLAADLLEVAVAAANDGAQAAPFGVGMHPYFRCGDRADDTELTLPVRSRLVLDDNSVPTGELEGFDGDVGRVGGRVLDAVLPVDTGLAVEAPEAAATAGGATATIAGPAGSLQLVLGPGFGWLVVFTGDTLPDGDRRRSVAVEPLTCPPNAFATGTDVIALAPGEAWTDHWTLRWLPR
jgi:aldose 1-epimerase